MGNPYKQLTPTERYQIQSLCGPVFSAHRIGDYLHRSNKAISLELKRCPPSAYDAEACARLIPNRVDIDERPDCVDLKEEIDHWEGIPFVIKSNGFTCSLMRQTVH